MNRTDSNQKKPALSIIMPVYNDEKYLEQTLGSALRQTLQNIELICIDDGSTDGSLNILSAFQEKDNRVHVIAQKNQGAGPARNAGLAAAEGEYIAFLDSDDFYPDDDCMKKLYDFATAHQANIAGGSLLYYEDGKISEAAIGATDFTFREIKEIRYRDFQQPYYYQRFIYSREMLEDASIEFPAYSRFQDVVFFVKAMSEAGSFWAMDTPVYIYRKSNKFASLSDRQINDMLRGYIDVMNISKEKDYRDLFAFLSQRICGNTPVSKMVLASIQSGNQEAERSYSEITRISETMQEKLPANNKTQTERIPMRGLRKLLRSLFPRP